MSQIRFYFFSIPSIHFGGGGSFLHTLSNYFIDNSYCSSSPCSATVFLINSHHWLKNIHSLVYWKAKGKKILLRVDGPLSVYRNTNKSYVLDLLINILGYIIADAFVYQSKWSRAKNTKIFNLSKYKRYTIIHNAFPAPPLAKHSIRQDTLLFVSNSLNKNKGYSDFLQLAEFASQSKLLQHLKFVCIGINHLPAHPQKPTDNIHYPGKLSKESLIDFYLSSKYYLHASRYEACSNALIEAISCNLLPLVYSTSSNIEIVSDDKYWYLESDQMCRLLEYLVLNYNDLIKDNNLMRHASTLEHTAQKYIDIAHEIL
jgi:glycosyltransferase involved in cell wall biosynthesis